MTRAVLMWFLSILPHVVEYIWNGPVNYGVRLLINKSKRKFTLPNRTNRWHK